MCYPEISSSRQIRKGQLINTAKTYERLINPQVFSGCMVDGSVTYICTHCKYRFKRKIGWNEKMCPFCGREGSIEQDVPIDKIIQEV
ncbi:hypothetical protein HZB88_03675 [archaeon]|nr:hypothetical protein [archaeon]